MGSDEQMDRARLSELFGQLLSRWQDRRALSPDLLTGADGVVLVGAGKVGQEFLGALIASGIPALAFTDNNPAKWGQTLGGLPVLPPEDAVRQFERRALFLVTIGRVGPGAAEVCRQFSTLGAHRVVHFIPAIQLIPRIWTQFFLAPDAFEGTDLESCLAAYRLFRDGLSRDLFVAHLRWRATLDPSGLPTPEYDNQYFPPPLIAPRHCATFVDIGAYTGDTLAAVSQFAGDSLRAYYGFEPDARNYDSLVAQAADVARRREDLRVVTRRTAIGAAHGTISFAGDGAATSQVSATGAESVECAPLDSLGVDPSYVKIDVEGAEADVLRGAAETMGRWKPTVAIATYHRPKDLFDLPLWLARNAPGYQFYLRSHGDAGIDLVCYAVREPTVS
jgi:FkbM family methyltransferase